ncbi:MAG: hypothetical protein PHC63_07045 [Candidatus Bathyarchaeota archaeon]|nr:hypothetical protein [Candidatus Bathyarchaeota archaeon]
MKTESQVRAYLKQWEETNTVDKQTEIVRQNIIAVIKFILET